MNTWKSWRENMRFNDCSIEFTNAKLIDPKTGEIIATIEHMENTTLNENSEQNKIVRLECTSYVDCFASYHDKCNHPRCDYSVMHIESKRPVYFTCGREEKDNVSG